MAAQMLWAALLLFSALPSLGLRHVAKPPPEDSAAPEPELGPEALEDLGETPESLASSFASVRAGFLARCGDHEALTAAIDNLGLHQETMHALVVAHRPQPGSAAPLLQTEGQNNSLDHTSIALVALGGGEIKNADEPAAAPKPNFADKQIIGQMGQTFNAMGGILGKWMTGQKVGPGDYTKLVNAAINSIIGVVSMVIGNLVSAALSSFLPVIGALIAGVIQAILALFMPKAPSAGQLISQAIAYERMRQNKEFWKSLQAEFGVFSNLFAGGEHDSGKLSWHLTLQHDLAVNKGEVFQRDCLAEATWSSDTCTQYIKDGMWETMLPYAELHTTVMAELLVMVFENPQRTLGFKKNQLEQLLKHTVDMMEEYHAALQHAWEVWEPHRRSWIWDPFHRGTYGSKTVAPCGTLWCEYVFHPFDFMHVSRWRGHGSLQRTFPLDSESKIKKYNWWDQYTRDRNGIQVKWKYDSCEEGLWPDENGTVCYEIGKWYSPIDMKYQDDQQVQVNGQMEDKKKGDKVERSVAETPEECQTRCLNVTGCAHFTWYKDKGCHLQDDKAKPKYKDKVLAGPRPKKDEESGTWQKCTEQPAQECKLVTYITRPVPEVTKACKVRLSQKICPPVPSPGSATTTTAAPPTAGAGEQDLIAREERGDLVNTRREYKKGDVMSPVELTDVQSITFLSGGEGCQVTFYDEGAVKDGEPYVNASVENSRTYYRSDSGNSCASVTLKQYKEDFSLAAVTVREGYDKSRGCGCNKGRNNGWNSLRLSATDRQCWKACMLEYRREVHLADIESFGRKVADIKIQLEGMKWGPLPKFEMQETGMLCDPETEIKNATLCEEKLALFGYTHSGTDDIDDEALPPYCSFKVDTQKLIFNKAAKRPTKGHAMYRPICGVTLFDAPGFWPEKKQAPEPAAQYLDWQEWLGSTSS